MCQVAGWHCANIRVSLWCNGPLPSSRGVPGLDFFDVFLKGAATALLANLKLKRLVCSSTLFLHSLS